MGPRELPHKFERAALGLRRAGWTVTARSILRDHMAVGEAVWQRFSVDRESTLRYYRELAVAFRDAGCRGYLIDELDRVVEQLHERSGVPMRR